jgi:hypothetical protein
MESPRGATPEGWSIACEYDRRAVRRHGESYRLNQSNRRLRRPKPDTPPHDTTQK